MLRSRRPRAASWAISRQEGSGMVEMSTAKRIVAVGPKQPEGILRRPRSSSGLVIFAHGAGSSGLSPGNNYVVDRLTIVPGATHLFEEPGTPNQVVDLAAEWFEVQFSGGGVECPPSEVASGASGVAPRR